MEMETIIMTMLMGAMAILTMMLTGTTTMMTMTVTMTMVKPMDMAATLMQVSSSLKAALQWMLSPVNVELQTQSCS